MSKRIVILGSRGGLGHVLVNEFVREGYDVTGWDKTDIDVTSSDLANKLTACKPDIIINAVAHTAVERAEVDPVETESAYKLNTEVPGKLAKIAKALDALLIHYSTDYVFKGDNKVGYSEDAIPDPQTVYGKSKYEGEKAIQSNTDKFYTIRLSRLFGQPGTSPGSKKNYIDIMLDQVDNPVIKAKNEEVDNLTYSPDLSALTRYMIEKGYPSGVYHGANEGACTPYEWGVEIFKLMGLSPNIIPVPTSEFPSPVVRPKFAKLINTKLPIQRSWQAALKECIEKYYKK
jgi:dTDP-4-dehydrorhamnose reductase